MSTSANTDHLLEAVTAGERLSASQVRALAQDTDILQIGTLADVARERRHRRRATYLRVAFVSWDEAAPAVSAGAGEVELTGQPDTLDTAVSRVRGLKLLVGDRGITGLSWSDIERLAGSAAAVPATLQRLRDAGLEALASLPLDQPGGTERPIALLTATGFTHLRLSVSSASPADRLEAFLDLGRLQSRYRCIEAVDPLPRVVSASRPTTGYEDVKMVALARLAAPEVPTIQLDWRRYGPKLAQVALTFGANDIHGVSASDDAPDGRRRAPVEEIRRNIEAAGFEPVERDARFAAR